MLLDEALEALAVSDSGIYIDGTFGRGGHAKAILQALGEEGRLLAIDRDPEAVAFGRELLAGEERFVIERGSFSMLEQLVTQRGWRERVSGILLDLGVSSPQLDTPGRGFSFLNDGPLDMRMDNSGGMSAADWLAQAKAEEIADVLYKYGDERFSRRIARAVVETRQQAPILTTGQLAAIITAAIPFREKGKHPATRSFQAIRIHVNRELEELESCLAQSISVLAPQGRLAVISFHSLEDRIVKRFIRDQAKGDHFPRGVPVSQSQIHPKMRPVGKAIRPSKEETDVNPRARSAVLRIAERLH